MREKKIPNGKRVHKSQWHYRHETPNLERDSLLRKQQCERTRNQMGSQMKCSDMHIVHTISIRYTLLIFQTADAHTEYQKSIRARERSAVLSKMVKISKCNRYHSVGMCSIADGMNDTVASHSNGPF